MTRLKLSIVALAAAFLVGSAHSQTNPSKEAQRAIPVQAAEKYAITPDGIRIYYRVAGTGEETVVAPFALYHGTALDALAKERRVVTYDPRGRGKSQAAPLDRVSLDFLLSDLETVRRAVGAERIAIIGWSGAGMETFVYALRNPGRVNRLVQLAPVAARAQPYTEQMMADRERRTNANARNMFRDSLAAGKFAGNPASQCRAESAVTVPAMFADPTKVPLVPDVCHWSNEQPPTIGQYFGSLWPSISTYDWRNSLDRVSIPRLVIYPLEDNIPRAGVEEWVRGQRNARILYLGNSGHFPQYEQPQATIEAIRVFLAGSWPAEAMTLPSE